MSLKLPYGLQDGRLCFVEDVERGLKCACVCPCCEGALIARKGAIKVAHFAHHREDCGKGLETALHMMAKEILEERREIALPELAIPPKLYTIEKVDLERRLGDVIPDVTVYIEGQPILIEIIVTHGIDQKKSKAIRELNISTLVIDLSGETRAISKDDLASIVVEGIDKKRWEYNRHIGELAKRRVKASRRMKVTKRFERTLHVDACPIEARLFHGLSFANVWQDCWSCEFLVGTRGELETRGSLEVSELPHWDDGLIYDSKESLNDPEPHGYILCDGHITIQRLGLAEWKAQRDAEHARLERLGYGGKFGGTWERQKESSESLKRRMDRQMDK